ncbi:universal stress protein [Nonomuraea africana]|uniref:Nucleotide-binding universal stress UspA family protein n=1 Tax=Nonomuraea africana TaxID=46171 RepID=A0ABR9KMK0_9ACTN|nr:universal stress protein [Nonomuraea africana]MBE1562782.1 nucleotide-binding universal stress UspA family protein [Nonomuraea africana]
MRGPVIAGTDGSAAALRAVEWAAEEAVYRRAPLVVAHAIPRWAVDIPVNQSVEADERARIMLADVVSVSGARYDGLEVTTEILDGRPEEALAERAADAQLLVLGSGGAGEFASLLMGSTSRALTARPPCPTVVVREPSAHGEVVVEITGAKGQDRVLAFAFEEAALRETPLRAVHPWSHPRPRPHEDLSREERRLMAEVLGGWKEAFPDVLVIQDTHHERDRERLLVEASERAAMVVVGAHGGLVGLSTPASHTLLRHARCPVAVVGC